MKVLLHVVQLIRRVSRERWIVDLLQQYLGIPDACTVQEAEQIKEGQPGDRSHINLANQLALVHARYVDMSVVQFYLLHARRTSIYLNVVCDFFRGAFKRRGRRAHPGEDVDEMNEMSLWIHSKDAVLLGFNNIP